MTATEDVGPQTLAGRVALLTGAGGGIGNALAQRLAQAGARLALTYVSSGDRVHELAGRLDVDALAIEADLARPEAVESLLARTERDLGPVEVLVANAGTAARKPLERVTDADWSEHLAVNLTAPFMLARAVVPGMRERGYGRLLFVSSVAAFTGGVVGPHYAASKAGLLGLTHSLAARFASEGITANAIAPALIEGTDMLPGPSEQLAEMVPVGRLGRPGEVADLAMAILGNGYVTNQTFEIDGGMHPR